MKAAALLAAALLVAGALAVAYAHSGHDHYQYHHPGSSGVPDGTFTLGTWYGGGKYRAPTLCGNVTRERDAWRNDLLNISSLGFNSVKVWVDWASAEPSPGTYNFDALRQILSLIDESNIPLKVLIQVYADSAPEWVGSKYPDGEYVGSNDRKIHSQAAPGYCLDHPGVRELVMNFYEQVGLASAQYPSLIYGFDLWSEPHVVNWIWFWDMDATQVEFCYCEHSLARFRSWLQNAYNNDLDALNSAWYRTFSSWDEVQPPRFGTIIAYTDYIDWLFRYTTDKLAEDLAAKAQALREGFGPDRAIVLTSHSASPSIINSPLSDYGTPDDWKMNVALQNLSANDSTLTTYYGTSIYPFHAESPLGGRSEVQRSYMYSGAYSASRRTGFFTGELQAGQGATGIQVNVPVTAADHRDWLWSLIAHGAKSIFFFAYYPMNSGYEAGGYGLVNLDSTFTERAVESGKISRIVTQYQSLFAYSQPEPAQVAVLYNPLAYFSGGNTVGPGTDIYHAMLGVYTAWFNVGTTVPVEFIHATDVEGGILLRNLPKLLYLPFPIAMSRACSDAIAAYVAAGGRVVSEARLAWTDEHGNANERIPGSDLDTLFGAQEELLRPVLTAGTTGCLPSYSFTFSKSSLWPGITVQSVLFEEVLRANAAGATVLATFDSDQTPAVVEYKQGQGKTLLIGGFPGLSVQQLSDANATAFIQGLLQWANVQPLVQTVANVPQGVDIRVLITTNSNGYVVIVINRAKTACVGGLVQLGPVSVASKPSALELITNTKLTVDNKSTSVIVHLPQIDPKQAAVVWLK
eukprot:TRINITY_DN5616_c0_g1_i1.p1 TRINITY_DN5616_c0_g1~~TRINITY_DN5616_c0_g1_i1.p1  ORF type:complete len:820 (-),score=161.63 TRINITY_DN5616_c0_g1_i1:77-2482(-)